MARPHRTIVTGAPPVTLRYTAPASMRQNPRITRPDAARPATTVGPPR